jgi:hexosaminidase
MKRILFLALIILSQNSSIFSQAISNRIDGFVAIDGILTEWDFANWITFKPSNPEWKDSAKVASLWDDNNIYFAFVVWNKNLQASKTERDAQGLYMDDGVEFLIDANLDRTDIWQDDDIAYHVNILNGIIDDRGLNEKGQYNNDWNGEAKTIVNLNGTVNDSTDIDKGYIVEISLPWHELNKIPFIGLKMGIDFCVNDRDDVTNAYRHFDWKDLKKFHVPSGFGTIELKK